MPADDGWSDYLTDYHRSHAGITERLLTRAVHPDVGTPYEWLRSALPRHPERVIDLACGSAPLYDLLPQTSHYVGLDVSEAELRLAADRERGPLLRADAGSLPIDRGSADAVVCSMAIMLLRPVETVLAEVARVLRPGGLFVTIRPVTWPVRIADVRVTVPLVLGLRHMPEVPQRFSRRSLRLRHTAAGLTTIDDRALRFTYPLRDHRDAAQVVEALYLPHVTESRRVAAVQRLARAAGPDREVPISIRRTVAMRLPID